MELKDIKSIPCHCNWLGEFGHSKDEIGLCKWHSENGHLPRNVLWEFIGMS